MYFIFNFIIFLIYLYYINMHRINLVEYINKLETIERQNQDSQLNNYLVLILLMGLVHYVYTYSTLKVFTFKLKSKYVLNDRFYKLMVSGDDGTVYNVGNNLWFWKWKSVELWDSLVVGQTYTVLSYGRRFPIADLFPTIMQINKVGK